MAFIDRVVDHPGRYKLINVDTREELGVFDLERDEGNIYEPGTLLNANNLNNPDITSLKIGGESFADWVIETGTDNSWNYKKWHSGKYEAWRNYQATSLVITTASAGTYYGGERDIPFPSFHRTLEASIYSNTLTQSSGVYIFSTVANGSNLKIYYRAHASINNASCGGFFYIRGTY